MAFTIRPARPEDAPDLSKLLLRAAGGIIDAIYHDLIPDKPTNEIVERRFHRVGMTSSSENCWVAESDDGAIAGKLHAYPMEDEFKNVPDDLIPEERFAVLDAKEVVGDQRVDGGCGAWTPKVDLAHMRDIEEANLVSNLGMLRLDAFVLHWHVPAAEVDHLGAGRDVNIVKWGAFEVRHGRR